MTKRATCLALLALNLYGCSFNTAKAADQWPLRYSKEGGTYQQLNEDGTGCLSGATAAMGAVTMLTLGLATPFMVAGSNSSVDLDDHAACMKAKGYTVHDQGPQKQP
jgi:hypothetical protein